MRKLVFGGDVKTVLMYVDKWKDGIKAVNTAGVAANSDELMRRWRLGSISQQQTTRPKHNVHAAVQRDRATDRRALALDILSTSAQILYKQC